MNTTHQSVPSARAAYWLALPSALTVTIVGLALVTTRTLPFWFPFAAIPACILATLDGFPTIWRSSIQLPIKLLLSAIHVLGFCLAAYPLFLGMLFYIPH